MGLRHHPCRDKRSAGRRPARVGGLGRRAQGDGRRGRLEGRRRHRRGERGALARRPAQAGAAGQGRGTAAAAALPGGRGGGLCGFAVLPGASHVGAQSRASASIQRPEPKQTQHSFLPGRPPAAPRRSRRCRRAWCPTATPRSRSAASLRGWSRATPAPAPAAPVRWSRCLGAPAAGTAARRRACSTATSCTCRRPATLSWRGVSRTPCAARWGLTPVGSAQSTRAHQVGCRGAVRRGRGRREGAADGRAGAAPCRDAPRGTCGVQPLAASMGTLCPPSCQDGCGASWMPRVRPGPAALDGGPSRLAASCALGLAAASPHRGSPYPAAARAPATARFVQPPGAGSYAPAPEPAPAPAPGLHRPGPSPRCGGGAFYIRVALPCP
jgi:hypothetical protein